MIFLGLRFCRRLFHLRWFQSYRLHGFGNDGDGSMDSLLIGIYSNVALRLRRFKWGLLGGWGRSGLIIAVVVMVLPVRSFPRWGGFRTRLLMIPVTIPVSTLAAILYLGRTVTAVMLPVTIAVPVATIPVAIPILPLIPVMGLIAVPILILAR